MCIQSICILFRPVPVQRKAIVWIVPWTLCYETGTSGISVFPQTVGEYWSLSTTLTTVIIVLFGLIMLTTMHNETFNSLIVHSGTENTPAGDKDLWGCVHCQTLTNQTKSFLGFFFFLNCISYNSKISNCCYRQTEPVKLWSSRLEVSGEKLLLDTVI